MKQERTQRKPLSADEVQRFEKRLHQALSTQSSAVEQIEREMLEPSGGSRFQPDDESIEEGMLDEDIDVLAAEDQLGYEIRDALERITAGSFGVCEDCRQWIERERLEVVPYARTCAACATARGAE